MNFILSIIKFVKFKPIIKFKKFERHNYGQTVAEIWRFWIFLDGFKNYEFLSVGRVKRVKIRHCAKFRAVRSNCC